MSATRIRGRAAVKLRRARLTIEPLCRDCAEQGRVTAAVEIDHIVPLAVWPKDKPGFEDASNWRPLCKDCHRLRTAEQFRTKPGPKRYAYDISGWPIGADR